MSISKLLRPIMGKRRTNSSTSGRGDADRATARCKLEGLETRRMLTASPVVHKIIADNRGYDLVYFNTTMQTSTFNSSSVLMYTAGKDGKLNTADDVKQKLSLHYSTTANALKIVGDFLGDTLYRVILTTHIKGTNGQSIHNAISHSDKAIAYEYDCAPVASTVDPTAIFVTTYGTMYLTLYRTKVANTVKNFLLYANDGVYDGTIVHRMLPTADISSNGIAIIQAGGFYGNYSSENIPAPVPMAKAIKLQAGIGNSEGTIAMARTSDPNSATNQFFFNTVANANLNADPSEGNDGYAVFGKVTNAASQSVLNAIDKVPTTALTDPTNSGNFTDTPLNNGVFVSFERISVQDVTTSV